MQVKAFLACSPARRHLLLEAMYCLAWANVYNRLPFSKVARSLGNQMDETSMDQQPLMIPLLMQIAQAVETASKHTWWDTKCLVRAIAAMKMLERRRIECTLYLGTAVAPSSGKLIAHAWLRSGSIYVTGSENMEGFTVVRTFAKNSKEKQGA